MIGMAFSGKVYIINKENGNKTIIGSTGLERAAGLTYDVTSSTMFVSLKGQQHTLRSKYVHWCCNFN